MSVVDLGYAAAGGWCAPCRRRSRPAVPRGRRPRAPARRQGTARLRANLRRVVGPDLPEAELDDLVRRGLRSYARYWMEAFRLPSLTREQILRRLPAGARPTCSATTWRPGAGAIVALPHAGNWDAAGAWVAAQRLADHHGRRAAQAGGRVRAVPRVPARRSAWRSSRSPAATGRRSTCSPTGCAQAHVVPLLADRDLSARGVEVRLLRRPHPDAGRAGAARAAHRRAAVRGRRCGTSRTPPCGAHRRAAADARAGGGHAGRAGAGAHPADRRPAGRGHRRSTRRTGTCCSGCGWTDGAGDRRVRRRRRRGRGGADVRIGIVCPYSFDVPGGVQNHVRDLAEALIALGHEVSVLAPADEDAPLPPYVVPAGRAVPVPYNGSVARLAFGPVSAARVRRWLADGDFDVLHVHEPLTPSLSLLAVLSAARAGGGHLPHRDDPVPGAGRRVRACCSSCWRGSPPGSRSARWPARCRSSTSAAARWRSPTGSSVARFAARRAAARLARARAARSASSAGSPSRARASRCCSTRSSRWPGDRPGLRLLVAGPGDPDEAARRRARPTLRERVTFLGLVSEEDKARMLRSVDVYVAPNTGGESFGMILTEAMAAGTPVVASDLDAFRRVLDGGRAGRAVPGRRRGGAGRALGRAARRPGRPGRAGRRARARWSAGYDWPVVARRVLEVYATAIEATDGAGRRRGVARPRHGRAVARGCHDPALRCPRMWWVVGVVARRGAAGDVPDLDRRAGSTGCTPGPRGGRARSTPTCCAGPPRPRCWPSERRRHGAVRGGADRPGRRARRARGGRERPDPAAARGAAAGPAEPGRATRWSRPAGGWRWPGRCTPTWSGTRWRARRRPLVRLLRLAGGTRCRAYFDIDDPTLADAGRRPAG